ncbi:hypothetical protein BpHYR1_039388 [Brachionus plicatilis]|uniref:Uncharacterized protein n=1 Tax=Brachionus plicatilis TaxID=10195 RepID=A0A3M7SUZ1_BRAPC|nr:hypothetical protein BpHYR1_039388 [Brachionus plicatilis]
MSYIKMLNKNALFFFEHPLYSESTHRDLQENTFDKLIGKRRFKLSIIQFNNNILSIMNNVNIKN